MKGQRFRLTSVMTMNDSWQTELDEYLSIVERYVDCSLWRVKKEFTRSGLEFDKKFRKHFLRTINNRVRETCDQFEIDVLAKEQEYHSSHHRGSTDHKNRKDHDYSSDSTSDSSTSFHQSAQPLSYKLELKKQNELSNNLCIAGIPQIRDENLRSIFIKLCKLLGAKISDNDIKWIRRDFPRSVITVELWSHNVKLHIARCSHSNYIWSDEVIRLPSGILRNRIYINDQMTTFYKEMWEIARNARKKKLIQTSWITDKGYMVKRTSTSQKRYFLSARDLTSYINKIRNADNNCNQKPLRRSASSSPDFNIAKRRR